MATSTWEIHGDYFETCSCDYLCPCIFTNLAGPMPKGNCTFAMVFHVNQGQYDGARLDDLTFAVLGHAPSGSMLDGNWSVGVITDANASSEQQQALLAIASGQAGGPMEALGGLIGNFLGMEARPIRFEKNGLKRSVSIPGVLEQGAEGVAGSNQDEPLYIDNGSHPANARLALAKSAGSHMHAFGLDWDDDSHQNNGQFSPFTWRAN